MESDSPNDRSGDSRKSSERASGEVIPLPGLAPKEPNGPGAAAREPDHAAPRDALDDPLDLLTRSLGAWGRAVHRQARDTDARVDEVAERVTAIDQEAARLRGEIDAHGRRLETGERRLGDAHAALDEHKSRLGAHEVALDAGTARHARLETQLAAGVAALKADAAAQREDAARLRTDLAALAAQNDALTRHVGRLRIGVVAALIAAVGLAAWIGWPHLAALISTGH